MFERKWENSFGKIGKKEFEGKGIQGKITKYPVAPSEIRTHDLRVTREKPQTTRPLSHMGSEDRNKKPSMYTKLCNSNKMAKANLICLSKILEIVEIYNYI